MIVNVTTLGSGGGSPSGSVGNIVNYLEGDKPEQSLELSKAGSGGPKLEPAGPGEYYADAGKGRWVGQGTLGTGFGLEGPVQREHFSRLLLGQDPHTGEQIMHNVGSARRSQADAVTRDDARHDARSRREDAFERGHDASGRDVDALGGAGGAVTRDDAHPEGAAPKDLVSIKEMSESTSIDGSYLRKVIRETNTAHQARQEASARGVPEPAMPDTVLDATKVGRQWMIERTEMERFSATRKPQQIVHGYDITFSAPKSVSVLWAASSPEVQQQISAAMTTGVEAGMSYLEDEGLWVRRGRGEERANGMAAAAYRHDTSRALEPQLHDHVVIPNLGWGGDGRIQALDARGLHAHATTAGHVADAALRRELSNNLGVSWLEVNKGSAEIDGVPKEAMRAMSSRRAQILSLSEQVGALTTHGRQIAALVTRADKSVGFDETELRTQWSDTLSTHGLDAGRAAELTPGPRTQQPQLVLTEVESGRLFREMSGAHGITESDAVFDRRDVIRWTADRIGTKVPVGEVLNVSDRWLASNAVPLELSNSWETIGRSGKVALSHEQLFSTPEMIGLEQRVLDLHEAGLDQQMGLVRPRKVEAAIRRAERSLGFDLGPDQAAAVRQITTSGHQFQAVQGLAGAGKTTAMSAAVDAWHHSGHKVIGLAPFGSAAAKLGEEIGIDTRTVSSFLKHAGPGPEAFMGPETVLLIDEASTLSNRQLDQLYRMARETGGVVRTVGDPQQHQAVSARGLWNELVERNEVATPILDINRRQDPETMQTVREALDTWRSGDRGGALDQLANDGRIKTAESWPELLDTLTQDWHTNYVTATQAERAPSQMIAERNRDRADLNARAQRMLRADGVLGADVVIGDSRFHIGDRVVSQAANRELHTVGAKGQDHVLNGSTGTIIGFSGPERSPDVVVDFDKLGEIKIPHHWIDTDVGQGRGGGLSPAYAVTSYKAEGQTYDAALGLAQPGAVNKEGMYVTLTRGRTDLALYSIDPNLVPERLEQEIGGRSDPRTMTKALLDSINRQSRPSVAVAADQGIAAALGELSKTKRSTQLLEAKAAAIAIQSPSATTIAAVGERPPKAGSHQGVWDQAVASKAVYEQRYGPTAADANAVPVLRVGAPRTQVEDHKRTEVAFDVARRAGVAQSPISELVAERQALNELNPVGQIEALGHQVTQTGNALDRAQGRYDISVRVIQTPEPKRRFRAAPPVPAAAQQAHLQASNELTSAKAAAQSARQTYQSYVAANEPKAVRQTLVDKAFTWRINAAVAEPSRYLVEAIGPRPKGGDGSRSWDRAAHMVERVRHNHGLTPNHGQLPGHSPLQRAVGVPNASWQPLVRVLNELTQTRDRGQEIGHGTSQGIDR